MDVPFFWFATGSFLLTIEFLGLRLRIVFVYFQLEPFYLPLEPFCLQLIFIACNGNVRLRIRKSVVSIKFPPVILGLEMAVPILWARGIFWFFLPEKKTHAHKIPPFRGGGFWVF